MISSQTSLLMIEPVQYAMLVYEEIRKFIELGKTNSEKAQKVIER